MSNEKWTPGPWVIDKDCDFGEIWLTCPDKEDPDFGVIALTILFDDQKAAAKDPNVLLASAAPELADYVKKMAKNGCEEASMLLEKARGNK